MQHAHWFKTWRAIGNCSLTSVCFIQTAKYMHRICNETSHNVRPNQNVIASKNYPSQLILKQNEKSFRYWDLRDFIFNRIDLNVLRAKWEDFQ